MAALRSQVSKAAFEARYADQLAAGGTAGRLDMRADRVEPFGGTGDEQHRGPGPAEPARGGGADPLGRTGDEHRAALHGGAQPAVARATPGDAGRDPQPTPQPAHAAI